MTSPARTALSVNVNKVALVRNTRHLGIPSVTRAAEQCLAAGAHGITVHPRPDARHIRESDVWDLAELLLQHPQAEFNIEGNPAHNLLGLVRALAAKGLQPAQVTFVPDGEGQFTSDHGYDLRQVDETLTRAIAECRDLGMRVSLFMDPEPALMARAAAVGAHRVELYTEPYAASWGGPDQPGQLQRYALAASAAAAAGLGVNAGHDLSLLNLSDFLRAAPQVAEVSIGHAFIGDALEMGYARAVQAYLAAIAAAA
ncbi:pyridoxine 5'-phosphate synthase [Comamonas serinivorans]|uniref:Pyridoxine 5'-phosphate synthase n=1 Tax=Comamonas serinivorans TaxID=1082851 RepID=A0A1Y0EJM5_9BURK|nr:pyridoxine 5'-phosphate synthase [Comamonas serinivorans]ARU03854.1 pyridoxine 5'-phosphate synthase [Comamonas serinivorans]